MNTIYHMCRLTPTLKKGMSSIINLISNFLYHIKFNRSFFLFRYSVTQGSSFVEQAQKAILDPQGDETSTIQSRKNQLRWDTKKKRFVRGLGIGSDNKKLITTEGGTKIPATYKGGRYALIICLRFFAFNNNNNNMIFLN